MCHLTRRGLAEDCGVIHKVIVFLVIGANAVLIVALLAAMVAGFFYGLRLTFATWAVILTVVIFGLLAPVAFWSADRT